MRRKDAAFAGSIGLTYARSKPAWPERPGAPSGAPNVVLIVLDDLGFAHLGCYGSDIATPNIDALAAGGLRYNRFHTTSLCTPSRACLLTGRNHHAVGMGTVSSATGFPGYHGYMTHRAATMAEILGEAGYGAYAIGKWHLTAVPETGPSGPFDTWPLGRGFDRYYGFIGGIANQFCPDLVEDDHPIDPPSRPGYHLSEDLVDRSIAMLATHASAAPARPFFLYLAFGAAHAPLHAPKQFIERYRGCYDAGWDSVRAEWFERQKRIGIVPRDSDLAPRNADVPAWDELTTDERRVSARLQEVFAGFVDHADAQIGRLVSFLTESGQLENTLLVVLSDNGADAAGKRIGRIGFLDDTLEGSLAVLDDAGSESSYPQLPAGWAQVGNTPLKWYKHDTYAGGIRDPLIVHWPARIHEGGAIRGQYHHIVDVLPTVLEAIGINAPTTHRGVPQMPLNGTSFAYTWDDAAAPTRKGTQYYECVGNRAIWMDGWAAVTHHVQGADYDAEHWALYDEQRDFSQVHDRSGEEPERLRELVTRWWLEAGANHVLPLDDRTGAGRHHDVGALVQFGSFTYHQGMARFEDTFSPLVEDVSHTIFAEVDAPTEAEGVLVASGGRFGGYVLYVRDGRLVYERNWFGRERTSIVSDVPLPRGRSTLAFRFERTAPFEGVGSLSIDGRCVGSAPLRTMRITRPTESLYCGREAGTAVGAGYQLPFPFTGHIRALRIETGRECATNVPDDDVRDRTEDRG